MTYMIVETGGKQYRMEQGGVLDLEKLETPAGGMIRFDRVLLVSADGKVHVGQPYVKGAVAEAEVLAQRKAKKLISYKYIRREGGAKTKIGHRQKLTRVQVKNLITA